MHTEDKDKIITYRKIFILWIPLAAMWLVMGIEQPLINGVITRMADAKKNLAAFGISFSIAIVIEAPIIQLLAAGTALTDSMNNYKRLLTFTHVVNFGIFLIHILLGLTPLYTLLLRNVIAIPEELIPLSRNAFLWMTPFGPAVGYRRLLQGILIRYKRTKIIPLTMIIRLTTTGFILLTGFYLFNLEGAELGGLALSCGVIAGAVSSFLFFLPVKRNLTNGRKTISWRNLLIFYYPLALTNFFTFIVNPVISFGLAKAAFPLESLAVWPVVLSLMFLFRSMAMAYQEVVVSLLNSSQMFHLFSRFAVYLGIVLTGGLLIIAITPAGTFLYGNVGGLNNELLQYTKIPTIIIALIPALTAIISWYRGLLIFRHSTGIIAKATLINSVALVIIILIGAPLFEIPGAIIASATLSFSMVIEAFYLNYKSRSMGK